MNMSVQHSYSQITELRLDLNVYNNQDNLDIEVTTEIDNKRIEKRITQNLKKRIDTTKLNDRPSIFDENWRSIIRKYPLKINIFNTEKKLSHNLMQITDNKQQETLNRIKERKREKKRDKRGK